MLLTVDGMANVRQRVLLMVNGLATGTPWRLEGHYKVANVQQHVLLTVDGSVTGTPWTMEGH